MERTGLLVGLALIGACGAPPPRFEAWSKPHVSPRSTPRRASLRLELPTWGASYGARRSACEDFEVEVDRRGATRHRRLRKPWTHTDRERFRGLVAMVAEEMGAEPRLFQAWARRESSYRPSALHVLGADVVGATTAWRKYAYDRDEEARLEAQLANVEATDGRYWALKGKLSRLRRFKNNPYLYAEVEYDQVGPSGHASTVTGSAWAFGYGPFGFNPAYFVQVWDPQAPPWVFCHHDGIPAIVTAIWAARAHQRECEAAGVGGSYVVLNRRLGRGHCEPPNPDSPFIRRLGRSGLDATRRAKLGDAHPAQSTDRAAVLEMLHTKAREQGLLSPYAQDPA